MNQSKPSRCGWALFLPLAVIMTCGAAGRGAAPEPLPVTDPVCVGWEKGPAVYQYSAGQGKWSRWEGPRTARPLAAFSAVGPHSAAVVDPMRGYSGWLFDLHTQEWAAFPASPIEGPAGIMDPIVVAFAGSKLIVWGMSRGDVHGAVLDPSTMKWRPMSQAPVAIRYRCAKAVIGNKLLVWGGYGPIDPRRGGPLADGAVYDLEKDTWEKIPDPPVPGRRSECVYAVWNDRLVLFGGTSDRGPLPTGVTYDPVTRKWQKMADAPQAIGNYASGAVHGDTLVVWSESGVGLAYDFRTGRWRNLPAAPIPARVLTFTKANDQGVTFWAGWDPHAEKALTDGAAYNLQKNAWSRIPDLPARTPKEMHPGW